MGERGGTGRKEEKEEKGESLMSVVRAPEKLHTERRSKLKRATTTTAGRSRGGPMHKSTQTLHSENSRTHFSTGGKQPHSQRAETTAGVLSRLIEALCAFKYGTKADIFCY